MSRFFVVFLIFSALIFVSCDNQKAGTFAVKFSWAKDGSGKEIKPDVSTGDFFVTVRIYEWKEGVAFPGDIAANGKQLIQSDSAQMKATGTSIDFGDLSYGSRRFVVAEIRKGAELTNSVLFTGMSQLFELKAGKHTEVNVEMSLTGLPGYDENGNNTFKIWVFHKDSPADRVPESRVALRFTVINANSVIIANDLNFEKGTAEIALTDLKKIDETTYEYSPWDFTTGWEEIGDGTYTVFGKLKNNIGQIGEPKRADVFLDTTPPVPNITPFKEVAKLGDRIEVRVLFDEAVDPESLIPGWQGLPFVLEENKEDKSFVYTYTVQEEDNEIEYQFSLTAADVVGNKTDVVDLGKVRIDKTAPDLSYIAMFKNGTEHGLSSNLYLKHGDVLSFELELNEEISDIPQLLLGPHKIICEEGEKELSFDCSLTIDKDVTYDVVADISLSFNDIAGNIYSRSIVSGAKIDTQVPQFIFRKNKDPQDYNATETIVLTITANEPVSMIEVNGTELDNTLTSWNISGKNETGTHEVKLKAVDLAGNEQTEFTVGTYKVDADYPSAVISNPAPVRISGTGSSVITVNGFNKPIASVKLNGIECTGEGTRTCTFNAPAGSGDSIESLTVTLTDFAGNISNISAGTVYVDRTAPEISGDATVIFKKPAGCPLSSVSSITSGSSVDISFIVNEPLKEIGDPLVSAEGEVNIIDFNMTGQIGYFYTFSKETINTEFLTDGTYVFKIEIEDEVGNKNNITLTGGFEIDTAKPDAPFVDEEERIVYRRIPWGSDETGGVKYFGLKATGNAVDENTSWVYAYDGSDPATASEIGKTAASGGTFSEFELNRSDRTEVYLAAYDTACNRSDVVKVRDVEWVATMGGKVPGSKWENPHVFEKNSSFINTLVQGKDSLKELDEKELLNIQKKDSKIISENGKPQWLEKNTNSAFPHARKEHSMVFDPVRGKVLFFGGRYYSGGDHLFNDIWEWDIETGIWSEKTPYKNNPSPRYRHKMVFDSNTGNILMFGGMTENSVLNDLWEWNCDLESWKKIEPDGPIPVSVHSHDMIYDPILRKIVVFGGMTSIVGSYSQDMWEFDTISNLWVKVTGITGDIPSARAYHSMSFDVIRRKIVLFGGFNISKMNDTWEWDTVSRTWHKFEDLIQSPAGRFYHTMVFDSKSGNIVVFGGTNGMAPSTIYNDIWIWNGTSWSEIEVNGIKPLPASEHSTVYDSVGNRLISSIWYFSNGQKQDFWIFDFNEKKWDNFSNYGIKPHKRAGSAMAYDENTGKMVLFGGYYFDSDILYFGDTWELDTESYIWEEREPSGLKPAIRTGHSMSFDEKRGKVILFGGSNNEEIFNDIWEWDSENSSWNELTDISFNPPKRRSHAMAYDKENGKTVVFGGFVEGVGFSNDLWEWNGEDCLWSERTDAVTKPSLRENHDMVFNPLSKRIMMFGGYYYQYYAQYYNDLWERDNETGEWTKISCETNPNQRSFHQIVFDVNKESLILFGGSGYTDELSETWEWKNSTGEWEIIEINEKKPSSRKNHVMEYSKKNGKTIMFGGEFQESYFQDLWEYDNGTQNYSANVMKIYFKVAQKSEQDLVNSVKVTFISGGNGEIDKNEAPGAQLIGWNLYTGEWNILDSNEALPYDLEIDPESGKLEWTTTDPLVLNRIFFGDQKTLNFAVTPVAPNGTGTGVIATDYAEVVVRYTITD